MKTLLLLRHAKSSWADPDQEDHERPLKKRGRRDAKKIGQLLREHELLPDLVLTSDARRALDTTTRALKFAGHEGEVTIDERLYLSGAEQILDVLHEQGNGDTRALVVGHNPDLEDLLMVLVNESIRLPTSTLTQIEANVEHWDELRPGCECRIVQRWRPNDLEEA